MMSGNLINYLEAQGIYNKSYWISLPVFLHSPVMMPVFETRYLVRFIRVYVVSVYVHSLFANLII